MIVNQCSRGAIVSHKVLGSQWLCSCLPAVFHGADAGAHRSRAPPLAPEPQRRPARCRELRTRGECGPAREDYLR